MILAIITFLSGISISSVAAYYSIIGLAAIFSGTFWSVVLMGVVLEIGKLVATAWVHRHWDDKNVSRTLKLYLIVAIFVLMTITAMGIYGYLSKSHTENANPMANIELQITRQNDLRIQLENDNKQYQTRLNQLDSMIKAMVDNNKVSGKTGASELRKSQDSERNEIQQGIVSNNKKITEIDDHILKLKATNLEADAKLGPVKNVAALFGWEDSEAAVRLVILFMMCAFDPLAIALVLCGTISLKTSQDNKQKIILNMKNEEERKIKEEREYQEKILRDKLLSDQQEREHIENLRSIELAEKTRESKRQYRREYRKRNPANLEKSTLIDLLDKNPDVIEKIVKVAKEIESTESETTEVTETIPEIVEESKNEDIDNRSTSEIVSNPDDVTGKTKTKFASWVDNPPRRGKS